MDSKSDGRHFFRVCFWLCFLLVLGLCLWWFAVVQAAGLDAWAVLSGSCCGAGKVVTLVFTIVFYGFQKWQAALFSGLFLALFFTRFGPVLMVVCRSAGGWFGRLGFALWVLLWCGQGGYTCFYNCFFMDSKSDGRHFFRVCFWLCFLLVLGLCLWWFAVVQAAGLDAWAVLSGSRCGEGNVVTLVFYLASYNCFFFMDSKRDGRHFFRVCFWFCFLLVLGLCLWWFAVVQAAGLDAWAVSLGLVVVRAMWLHLFLPG